jgi:hypothetical protein
MNSATAKVGAWHELLFNKLASGYFALVPEKVISIEGDERGRKTLIFLLSSFYKFDL